LIGNPLTLIEYLYNQDKNKIFEIKEKKNKRSLSQNGYSWTLQYQLASKLKLPIEELHFNLIKSYGVFEVISVLDQVDTTNYFEYFEEIGKSELNGKVFKHIRLYKPTHKMNSTEMARFIDGVVSECKLQDIPTLTPDEIKRMEIY